MSKIKLLVIIFFVSIVSIILAMGLGSVYIKPIDSINIISYRIFKFAAFGYIDEVSNSILWKIRIPRIFLAFVSGAGLSISGVMMQSILRNPLASSFTLGVSSGASLGASIAILFKISIFGLVTLPIFGLIAGVITVFFVLSITTKIDKNIQNNSVILTGMAFSLFANAIVTIIMSMSKDQLQQLVYWQMGSFAAKTALYSIVLIIFLIIVLFIALKYSNHMDIMTLGDEQAKITGVEVKQTKLLILSLSAIITGAIVSIVGIIGFVDLFIPHMARKLFGSSHKWVLSSSLILGGTFMVFCDLISRTLIAPLELPVSAITSALGAPFFIYFYFEKRRRYDD